MQRIGDQRSGGDAPASRPRPAALSPGKRPLTEALGVERFAGAAPAAARAHVDAGAAERAHADAGAEEADDGEAPASLRTRTRQEDRTRVGFEIEPGGHYTGPASALEAARPYINQTLLTFTTRDGRALLEMLLDDPRVNRGKVIFQVEFRTTPLEIADIAPATARAIRAAIGGLSARNVFIAGQPLGAGWARARACDALIAAVGSGQLTTMGRFQAPGDLAQHVTSSINLGAYPALPPRDQQALYARGRGSTTRVELYRSMLRALGSTATIDASTRGRNTAAVTVKSSIEALLAAEQAHEVQGAGDVAEAMTREPRPTAATVGEDAGDQHAIAPDLPGAVAAIRDRGTYPTLQGEAGAGYLAVAEKMQPPLLDPGNHQLRVLIEHRTDELRAAVNKVLAGKPSPVWDDFVRAAGAMDHAR